MKNNILSKISWSFAKKYRITIILWVVLLVFGFFSYTTLLKREGFPSVNLPISIIQGTYFVDDSSKVDQEVVQPISEVLKTIDDVDTFQTSSGSNGYNIYVTFKDDITSEDGAKDVQAALNDQLVLPDEVNNTVSPVDAVKFNNKYSLLLSVYDSRGTSYQELENKAEIVASELVEEGNIDKAEAVPTIKTINNLETGITDERQVAINKVAIREDGKTTFYPAVNVGVVKDDSIDDIELSKIVTSTIEDIDKQGAIGSAKAVITADYATTINSQIDSLQSNLIGGLIAVIIVALLLISWRAALVIAVFIPTVTAAVFGGLTLLGFTLNTITLFATILTLGLFVDDATIIVEAIDAHRKDKAKHKEIIKAAIGRVGIASVAGTLTTVLVFTPMFFVSGVLGDFIQLLPITVIIALVSSLVISIVLIPFVSRPLVLSGSKRESLLDKLSFLVPVERFLSDKLSKLPLLNKRHAKAGTAVSILMVSISIIAIIGGIFFARKLSLDIFPQSKDSNILKASIEFESGTTISEAEEITKELDDRISSAVGEDLSYASYVSGNERGANIQINLVPFGDREATSHDILDELEATGDSIDGAKVVYSQKDAGPTAEEFPFQMRIYSSDDNKLIDVADEVEAYIASQTLTFSNDESTKVAEVKIDNTDSINRTEKGRYLTVVARFDNAELNSAAVIELKRLVSEEFDASRLESLGVSKDAIDFNVGQESKNADSFGSIGIGLIAALIMMYILLVLLFNSWSQPILIFMAIPFSLFGVFFGLWLTDNSISFFVMLGLLGLIGIVVNNSILLTEYANQEKENGADRYTAISNAIKDRFRPLVTTTTTTVCALIPLALTDPFWQSIANTLIFGMISSSILIVLSFPYYYLFFERIREWKNKKFPALK